MTIYCYDAEKYLNKKFNCCSSCHEDQDYGYELLSSSFGNTEYYRCCGAPELEQYEIDKIISKKQNE